MSFERFDRCGKFELLNNPVGFLDRDAGITLANENVASSLQAATRQGRIRFSSEQIALAPVGEGCLLAGELLVLWTRFSLMLVGDWNAYLPFQRRQCSQCCDATARNGRTLRPTLGD